MIFLLIQLLDKTLRKPLLQAWRKSKKPSKSKLFVKKVFQSVSKTSGIVSSLLCLINDLACYFNSLMQAYYMLPTFMENIIKFKPDKRDIAALKEKVAQGAEKAKREVRKLVSIELVAQLQRLFAYLSNSNRKCVDTRCVTSAVVDDFGKPVKIGEQKDVGEFNINFLARVHDALEVGKDNPLPVTPSKVETDTAAQKELERSVALGMSVLLPVAPEQLSKSFIYNTFFGSFAILTKAIDKDGKVIELKTNTTFGQIMVNACEKDIYSGWQKNYFNEVEDFQTPSVSFHS